MVAIEKNIMNHSLSNPISTQEAPCESGKALSLNSSKLNLAIDLKSRKHFVQPAKQLHQEMKTQHMFRSSVRIIITSFAFDSFHRSNTNIDLSHICICLGVEL